MTGLTPSRTKCKPFVNCKNLVSCDLLRIHTKFYLKKKNIFITFTKSCLSIYVAGQDFVTLSEADGCVTCDVPDAQILVLRYRSFGTD